MSKFKIGEKVRIVGTRRASELGLGTVRIIEDDGLIGVEVDDWEMGHSLGGICPPGKGWWFSEEDLEPLEADPFPIWSKE